MGNFSIAASVALATAFGAATSAQAQFIPDLPDKVANVLPSVVRVFCAAPDASAASAALRLVRPDQSGGVGTGIIFNKAEGYILTNNHVTEECGEIRVVFHHDQSRFVPATLMGADARMDVSVLKVPTMPYLKEMTPGNSDDARLGESVFAIGNPFGMTETVTTGIISAKGRERSEIMVPMIQTDTVINPGNSGGPLFNKDGHVIGVNQSIISRSGGFAGIALSIPIKDALWSAERILQHGGSIPWGVIGVQMDYPDNELVRLGRGNDASGMLIKDIAPGSPAERYGLQKDDIVLMVNGVAVNHPSEMVRIVAKTLAGNTARIDIWRDGQVIQKDVVTGQLPFIVPPAP